MANHVGNKPWPSLDWASWIFDRASFALAGSLVIGALATGAIVWMGIVKERHWDLLREASNEKVAALESETAKANAELGKANADIAKATAEIADARMQTAHLEKETATAKEQTASLQRDAATANERAAALEKDAAEARLEQERLKQIVSWRGITRSSAETMVRVLKGSKPLVKVAYVAGDAEALYLAIQFSKILEAAEWRVIPEAMTFSSQLVFEIRVPGPENPIVDLLRKGLAAGGVVFSTESVPTPDMAFVSQGQEAPQATIFFGSKRPPF